MRNYEYRAAGPYRSRSLDFGAKVDADGIDLAGIRLSDIAVPVGTYTG